MQTIRPSPASPRSAAASASAPAPSATTWARAASSRIAVERHGGGTVDERPRPLPHCREKRAAAGAVDEGRAVVDLDRSARAERRRERSGRLRLGRDDASLRAKRLDRARDPGREAAAAPGHDHRVEAGEVLAELETDRAVAGHDGLVVHRVHEQPVDSLVAAVDHRLPPDLVRHEDELASEALDRVELRPRRVLRRNDPRAHARLASGPCDALRHVPSARGDDAAGELAGRGGADSGQRAA